MDNPLKNLFAVTDLRNRILFTLALIGVFRVGSHVTIPGVNRDAIAIWYAPVPSVSSSRKISAP